MEIGIAMGKDIDLWVAYRGGDGDGDAGHDVDKDGDGEGVERLQC